MKALCEPMKRKIGATNHFSIAALTVLIILIVWHDTQAFQPWKSGASWGSADPDDQSHESITEQAITEFCAEQRFPQPSRDAIEGIVNANGYTDLHSAFNEEAYFDNESFRNGQSRLQGLDRCSSVVQSGVDTGGDVERPANTAINSKA